MTRTSSTVIACAALGFAVCAGILETVIAVGAMIANGGLAPDAPIQIGVRATVFALAFLLIGMLWSGRRAARWLLLILLGVIGLGSMVVPMIILLMDGAGVVAALDGDVAPGFAVIRAAHIVLVVIGMIALLKPQPAVQQRSDQTSTVSSSV